MHSRFVHSNGSLNPPCTNLCPTIHHRQRNKFQIYRSALIVTREPVKIGLKKEGRMGNNKGVSKPLLPRSKGRPCRCRRGSAGRCTAPSCRGPIPAGSERHRCPSPAEERERVFFASEKMMGRERRRCVRE